MDSNNPLKLLCCYCFFVFDFLLCLNIIYDVWCSFKTFTFQNKLMTLVTRAGPRYVLNRVFWGYCFQETSLFGLIFYVWRQFWCSNICRGSGLLRRWPHLTTCNFTLKISCVSSAYRFSYYVSDASLTTCYFWWSS